MVLLGLLSILFLSVSYLYYRQLPQNWSYFQKLRCAQEPVVANPKAHNHNTRAKTTSSGVKKEQTKDSKKSNSQFIRDDISNQIEHEKKAGDKVSHSEAREASDRQAMPPPPPPPPLQGKNLNSSLISTHISDSSISMINEKKNSFKLNQIPNFTVTYNHSEENRNESVPSVLNSSIKVPVRRNLKPEDVKAITSIVFSQGLVVSSPNYGSSVLPRQSPASRLSSPLPYHLPTTGLAAQTSNQSTASARPNKKVILTPGHSPLDWARLSNSSTNLSGLPSGSSYLKVTPSLLKMHTGRRGTNAWTVLGGKVYNITPYLPFHPGGEPELLRCAGRDGSKLFAEVHPWVNWEGMLAACLVGIAIDECELQSENKMLEMD